MSPSLPPTVDELRGLLLGRDRDEFDAAVAGARSEAQLLRLREEWLAVVPLSQDPRVRDRVEAALAEMSSAS